MNRHRQGKGGHRRPAPELVLQSRRFEVRIKTDRDLNRMFQHCGAYGLGGYELKNIRCIGFALREAKDLWFSKTDSEARKLVISESAIVALSHAILFPDGHARYASIGGKPDPVQPDPTRRAISQMPEGCEIVAAMDADDARGQAVRSVYQALQATLRVKRHVTKQEPRGFKDWNDHLLASKMPFFVRVRMTEAQPA